MRFDCRVKDVYCTKCKSSGSHVASTCRNNDRGRSSSRGRDNSRGRNASRGRDRNRNDSKNNRKDSRGQTPGHRDRSDSRRRSNSRNDRHRARSVDHTETLGHEIVNRVTTTGQDYDDNDADDRDEDGFTEGHFTDNCYRITAINDDNADSSAEENDADESISDDITPADEFTEGNYVGESEDSDEDETAETVDMDKSNKDEDLTAEECKKLLSKGENDESVMETDVALAVDNRHSVEEPHMADTDIEYYWSDDDEDETVNHRADDSDNELMISLMTTNKQDMSVILSDSETRRQREKIFPSLCHSCQEIVKYFPLREADTGMLFPTESDIVTRTDSVYFDRQKCDSQSRHEMSARGNQTDISHNDPHGARETHGARENHFCYRLASNNQTPTVQMDFSTKPNSRISFSIHSCPDTGATKSVIRAGIVRDKKLQILPSGDASLRDAQGVYMKVEGKVRVYVSIRGGKKVLIEALVSSSLADNFLLCWRDQKSLGILPNAWPYPPGSDHWVRIAKEGWMSTNSPELSRQMSDSGLATVGTSTEIQGLQRKVERMVREDSNPPTPPADTKDRPEIAETLAEMLQRDTWPPHEWPAPIREVVKKYSDVFSDSLEGRKRIAGPAHSFEVLPGATPYRCHGTRHTPIHWQAEAKRVIDEALKAGIIERWDDPSDWLSPAHFVEKTGPGPLRLRLVCDLTRLNHVVIRPIHKFMTGTQIWQQVHPTSKFFAKLDCTAGYHQVEIEKGSRHLFTFILPDGKFRYTSTPMGFAPSGDIFCQATDRALRGTPALKEVDDILIQGASVEELAKSLEEVLQRCQLHHITLSVKKMQCGDTVSFAGYIISALGTDKPECRPDPTKIEALKAFKQPTNITEVRSFLGAAQQMGAWHPDLSQATLEMRTLLKQNAPFQWTADTERSFQKIKSMMSDQCNLSSFHMDWWTELITDASYLGLGFVLIQRDDNGKWHLIWCGSCSLTSAQTRYAPIMLELLAAIWGITSCAFYLRGIRSFTLRTDHKPLVGLMKKDLRDLTERQQTLREKVAIYTFTTQYLAGKLNMVADLLSRQPLWGPQTAHLCQRVIFMEDEQMAADIRSDPLLANMFEAVACDPSYKLAVKIHLEDGNKKAIPEEYRHIWSRVSLLDRKENTLMLVDGSRILVPLACRRDVLKALHLPHCGTPKTRANARSRYYWYGLSNEVKNTCDNCRTCLVMKPSQAQDPSLPLVPRTTMSPMDRVGTDIFHFGGCDWLVMCDWYSGYPMIKNMGRSHSTESVLTALEGWFRIFGYCQFLRHDNGPAYRQRFVEGLKAMGIRSEPSSPYHPESNGLAEASVKNMKGLLLKCKYERSNFDKALAQWLQTPREDGYSPSDLFFRRHLRGLLPSIPRQIDVQKGGGARDKGQQRYRDQMSGNKTPLTPLEMGDSVVLQDPKSDLWDTKAKVVEKRHNGRSYWVETEDGESFLRGRPMIRKDISSGEDITMTPRQTADSDRQLDSQDSQDTDIVTADCRDTCLGPRQDGPMTASRQTALDSTHTDRRLRGQDTDPVSRRTRSKVRFDSQNK